MFDVIDVLLFAAAGYIVCRIRQDLRKNRGRSDATNTRTGPYIRGYTLVTSSKINERCKTLRSKTNEY